MCCLIQPSELSGVAQLLEVVFSGPYALAVPDFLYEKELRDSNGAYLQQLGLGVVALSPAEMAFAQQLSQDQSSLSIPDCFALSCARRQNHRLLTGDRRLRVQAEASGVLCFGLLWLLDRLYEHRPELKERLFEGLQQLSSHPQCRLPHNEVRDRLTAWAP